MSPITVCRLFCLIFFLNNVESKVTFYSIWNGNRLEVYNTSVERNVPGLYGAKATYENQINETGWAFLEIRSSKKSSDAQQAFASGYMEGFLTQNLIWMHWQNVLKGFCDGQQHTCDLIDHYVSQNEVYIDKMVNQFQNNSYWYQIKLYMIQLEGVAMGYGNATDNPKEMLTFRDIFWINMLGDVYDLATALNPSSADANRLLFGADRCSGLVKLLPDHSDLFVGQTTWNSYQSMLRIQKKYVMHLSQSPQNKNVIPGQVMTMSSYPGFVQSTDDFYVIGSGLVAAETTTGNGNMSLFKNISPNGQILEFMRVMVANRLARTGAQWVDIFKKHNSGTYNNQWYIVDYKQFRPSKQTQRTKLKKGLLWIVEQLPGYTEDADMTDHLKQTSYWPSYNTFYFPRMFNLSGSQEAVEKYGEMMTYDGAPRAKIFKREQANIKNLDDMFKVMRYNNYKNDPLSRCEKCNPIPNAWCAIAARNDLNPVNGTYAFESLGHRDHGATDAKVTSYSLQSKQQFLAVSSPPYSIANGIPPYRWSETDFKEVSHIGHPDVWQFDPLVHQWTWG